MLAFTMILEYGYRSLQLVENTMLIKIMERRGIAIKREREINTFDTLSTKLFTNRCAHFLSIQLITRNKTITFFTATSNIFIISIFNI